MLGLVDADHRFILADLEAGIGTLTRMGDQSIDVLLVVVEPTPKSIEVGSRLLGLVGEGGFGRAVVVANRLRGPDDRRAIEAAFPSTEIIAVPEDPAVLDADRLGVAVLDLAPDAPAVRALKELGTAVLR